MQRTNAKHDAPSLGIIESVRAVASGTVLSQLLLIIVSPLLTRLYTPQEFGHFAVYAGLCGILALLGCFRYDEAIPYASDDESAAALAYLGFFILVLYTAVLGLIMYTGAHSVFSVFNLPQGVGYAWAIPATVFFLSCFAVGQNLALRQKRYAAFAYSNVSQSLATGALQILLGVIKYPSGLVVGYVVGRCLGAASTLLSFRALGGLMIPPLNRKIILRQARKYHRFPLYTSWSSILNQISIQLPPFFLGAFFGSDIAGLFALGQRVLELPALVISQSFSKVFISLAYKAKVDGTLQELTETMVRTLALLGLPGLFLVGLVSPELFSLIFGAPWRQAGVYAQWLLPWLAVTFIASPLAALLPALQLQKYELLFQLALFSARAGALATGFVLGRDPILSVALFGIVSAVCWALFMIGSLSLVGHGIKTTARWIAQELLLALPFTLPLALLKAFGASGRPEYYALIASVCCILGLFPLSLWRLTRMYKNGRSRPKVG